MNKAIEPALPVLREVLAQLAVCAREAVPLQQLGNFQLAGQELKRALRMIDGRPGGEDGLADLTRGDAALRRAWHSQRPAKECGELGAAREAIAQGAFKLFGEASIEECSHG